MKKFLETMFNHERYQSIAVIVIILLLVWTYGCPSHVQSLTVPGKTITRPELQVELDTIVAMAAGRVQDLDKQDSIKQLIFQQAMLTAQGGQINLMGVIATAAATLGIGATVDNVRKRKEIKDLVKT